MSDKLFKTVNVYVTEDYEQFSRLPGNRPKDESHVRYLVSEMTKSGLNISEKDPVVVNKDMQVLDGQHTLEALERLGWPVCYEFKEIDIHNVRAMNSGRKNWAWHDYADSFAELGNKHYARFILLAENYDVRFSTLLEFVSSFKYVKYRAFKQGELQLTEYDKLVKLLDCYQDWKEVTDTDDRDFARTAIRITKRANYDHERMLRQLSKYISRVRGCYTADDYTTTLEHIYNEGLPVEERI